MIAWIALVALWLGSSARVDVPPRPLTVGEPFEMTFVVEHPAGAGVLLPTPQALSLSFAFQEDRGRRREPLADGRERTSATWLVRALEGGAIDVPALRVTIEGQGQNETIETAPLVLQVRGALRAGEDAPRPPRTFHEAPEDPPRRGRVVLLALATVGVVLVGVLVARRARPKAAVVSAIRPEERLAALERRAQEPGGAREAVYGLVALVRASVDDHLRRADAPDASTTRVSAAREGGAASSGDGGSPSGPARAALTDDAWLALVRGDARVPADTRERVVTIVAQSERWKYAGEEPSTLGLRESFESARAVVAALASGPDAGRRA